MQTKNWEKLQKICNPNKKPSPKRSLSRDCRSIPIIKSSRIAQRRGSQEQISKVLEYSTIDIDSLSQKQQIDSVFAGLNGLLGYELVMKKETLERLLNILKSFVYFDTKEMNTYKHLLLDLSINYRFRQILSYSDGAQPIKEFCEFLIQELACQNNRQKLDEVKNHQFRQDCQQQIQELLAENKELKIVVQRFEHQIEQLQLILQGDKSHQQIQDLKRYNKKLSDRNDFLHEQNTSLLQKIEQFYQSIESFNEQLTISKSTEIRSYAQSLQLNLNKQLNDVEQLQLSTPHKYKYVDVDFKNEIIDLTPRPNYELLITKYPIKAIKFIRGMKSTCEITKYLINQVYQHS